MGIPAAPRPSSCWTAPPGKVCLKEMNQEVRSGAAVERQTPLALGEPRPFRPPPRSCPRPQAPAEKYARGKGRRREPGTGWGCRERSEGTPSERQALLSAPGMGAASRRFLYRPPARVRAFCRRPETQPTLRKPKAPYCPLPAECVTWGSVGATVSTCAFSAPPL